MIDKEYQSGLLISIEDPKDPKYSFQDMHDYFYEKDYTIYPGKIEGVKNFRLSVIGQIYKNDIISFLEELKIYLEIHKLEINSPHLLALS